LVSPQQWSIQLGEESLSAITYASVFSSLGYFYQDPLVFDGTLRENLSLNAALDDTALIAALHKVSLWNMSLDTIIGERWVLLSGWEKQRLALARIFLFDYDIILLDEPTSNLDLQLEKEILWHIFEHCKDKTLLIISHRPFVLDYVDRVIVMHKWEIKADWSFKEVRDDIEWLD
jgi:ABC-type transport system involved in cytochrome bd biosynthesis fused ATPase/permease subunit